MDSTTGLLTERLAGLTYPQLSKVLTKLSEHVITDRNAMKHEKVVYETLNQVAYDLNHAALELDKAVQQLERVRQRLLRHEPYITRS